MKPDPHKRMMAAAARVRARIAETRQRQVEADDQAALAIAREAVRQPRRVVIWAIHELRDMGAISRDLVEVAERFAALHLKLEPRAKCAFLGDAVGGGSFDLHARLLRRSALAERVDELYALAAKKLGPSRLGVFAMAFDPSRPSISDLKSASGLDFASLSSLIETGLTKLYMAGTLEPSANEINSSIRRVNGLVRI